MGTVSERVYRVCERSEWERTEGSGIVPPAAHDRRDGFMHLSTAAQLAGTLARHYPGRDDLVLLTIALERLPSASLRWEPKTSLTPFPHFYNDLQRSAVIAVDPLPLDEQGIHRLPAAVVHELAHPGEREESSILDVKVRWNELGFAELEYPRLMRIEDEATIYAWEALLERRLAALVEARGPKLALLVHLDNLWVSPKLARRYTELADKVISRWVTRLARWGSQPITSFVERTNDERKLPSNVFPTREEAIAFLLADTQSGS